MSYSQIQQSELIILSELAGIYTVPGVFRAITELLALQVSPEDIYSLLRQVCLVSQKKKTEGSKQGLSKPDSRH